MTAGSDLEPAIGPPVQAMARQREILRQLRKLDDPSVDRALAAAIPSCGEMERASIVSTLLDRRHDHGLTSLIEQFHRLPTALRSQVVRRIEILDRPLRNVASRGDSQAIANVVAIIREARASHLAYLIAEQLRRGRDAIHGLAAECLLFLSFWVARRGSGSDRDWSSSDVGHVTKAVEMAVIHYGTHERSEILLAFVVLASRPMPGALATLADHRHPAVRSLKHLIRTLDRVELHRSLLTLITVPTLSGAVRDAVSGLRHRQKLGELIVDAHLAVPSVTDQLRRTGQRGSLIPTPEEVRGWPVGPQRGFARWVAGLGLAPHEELVVLRLVGVLSDRSARLLILRRLMVLSRGPGGEDANELIADRCADSDPWVGRVALRHLTRVQWSSLIPLLPRLVNKAHPRVRDMAARQLSDLGFDCLWKGWTGLEKHQRLSAGRALIKIDRDFHRHLAARLDGGDRGDTLRALGVIGTLDQGFFFESALVALARHPDEIIASAAVNAINPTRGEPSRLALADAMQHPDPRVRANAIEVMQRIRSTRHELMLTAMARNEDNRPRANAISALMGIRHPEAADALSAMLVDRRARHRISALWVVGQNDMLPLAGHVAELSISDPDREVKNRAEVVVGYLMGLMGGRPAGRHQQQPANRHRVVGALSA